MSLSVNQKLVLSASVKRVWKPFRAGLKSIAAGDGASPRCSSALASGLLAWASSSIRVPSRARKVVRPGARVWGAIPV